MKNSRVVHHQHVAMEEASSVAAIVIVDRIETTLTEAMEATETPLLQTLPVLS